MKYIAAALLFMIACSRSLSAEDAPVGKLFTVKHFTKEVIISSPLAADQFVHGDKLVLRNADGREFVLTVTFPMMSVAKCSVQRCDIPCPDSLKQCLFVFRYDESGRLLPETEPEKGTSDSSTSNGA